MAYISGWNTAVSSPSGKLCCLKVPPKHISTSAFTNLGPVCTPDHEWPAVCITQYHFVTPVRSAWRQETQCCQSRSYHQRRTGHTSYAFSGITDFIHNTDMKQTQQFKHLQFMPQHAYTLFQKKVTNKVPWVPSIIRFTRVTHVPVTVNASNQKKTD